MAMDRQRIFRAAVISAIAFAGLIVTLAILQQLLVPVLVWFWPYLETPFYDLGFFGAYRTQDYVSFNLSSPQTSVVQWEDSCDHGYVFIDPNGPSVEHRGPTILDSKGNLIWTSDQFETTTNLKLQMYRGQEYLTFWSGQKAATMGTGAYYMMDSNYTIVLKVDAYGDNMHGDLHEFKITKDNTALLTVYNVTNADLTGMGWFRSEHGWIVDSVFQEVDIATGRLLFEWKASDHFDAADSYMWNPFGGYTKGGPFDFFHINSIDKDANGNYLVSSRHFHCVMGIDGVTGDVMWVLGGHSEDFDDISDGFASDFSWQHDARWLSEEEGILSLFDNSKAWPHVDAPYSTGRVIQIDVENRTAELLHSYVSLQHASSSSQGSVQFLANAEGEERVFIGWGSSAAYSEFTPDGQLLCETHFAASGLYWWERVKSYRAFKTLEWSATPAAWDPSAVIDAGKLYVSWNGATDVRFWSLQGANIEAGQEQGEWQEVDIVEKIGFEESFNLPSTKEYTHFRVAALDAERGIMRHSNIATRPASGIAGYLLATVSAILCVAAVVGLWQYRKRGRRVDWRQYAQYAIDRTKYQKLW